MSSDGEQIRSPRRPVAWIGFEDAEPAPRPPLSPRRIVEAALRVVDEHGLTALSIRQLGTELGVTPMAIYGHFVNKEQLLDRMLDFVLGEVDLEPAGDDPLDAVRAIVTSVGQVFQRHPGMARIYSGSVRIGPNGLRTLDVLLGHLLTVGLPEEEAARTLLALYTYTMGHHQIGRVLPLEGFDPSTNGTDGFLGALAPDQVPYVAVAGRHLFGGSSRADRFETGLDLLFGGLRGRLGELANPTVAGMERNLEAVRSLAGDTPVGQ